MMKKIKIFGIKAIVIIFVMMVGCSEDFLDIEPKGVITMDSFYQTDQDARQAIFAVYDILQSMNAEVWHSMWMIKTLQADEMYTGGGFRGDQSAYEELNEFRYGSSNAVISAIFRLSYWAIYRANLVIENVEPDTPNKKIAVAEAKALRALLYFDLVDLWGKVPLALSPAKKPGEYNLPREDVEVIWKQIEQDLLEAIDDLPLKSEQEGPDVVRFSKGAAQTLLGKTYLFLERYAEAADEFQKVIDSEEYDLVDDYSIILKKESEFGIESIFEISYSEEKNYDWPTFNPGWSSNRPVENNIHWQLLGPRGEGHFSAGNSGLIPGWGMGYPTKSLYDDFVNQGDTVRLKSSIMSEDDLIALGGKLRNDEGNFSIGCEGYIRLKYGSWASESSSDPKAVIQLNYGTNVRIFRYADVLLMAAEAYNQSNNDALSLQYLNQVRERVQLPAVSKTGEDLFEAIKTERKLELAFEGSRFQDLKRWGMAKTVLADQGKMIPNGNGGYLTVEGAGFKDKNMLLPIPEQEIEVNPLASPNNPGY